MPGNADVGLNEAQAVSRGEVRGGGFVDIAHAPQSAAVRFIPAEGVPHPGADREAALVIDAQAQPVARVEKHPVFPPDVYQGKGARFHLVRTFILRNVSCARADADIPIPSFAGPGGRKPGEQADHQKDGRKFPRRRASHVSDS